MTEHYFSQKPQSKSSPKTWHFTLRERNYQFTSDYGVFSKQEVDFGSRLLIEYFTAPETEGDILDLGCGYGPIGVALADAFPKRDIVMADINERAVELAKQNVQLNHIDNATIIQSDRFASINDCKFAAVVTNPPIRSGKKVVHSMFEESKRHLRPAGELWVVIQKKQGAPSAKEKLEELFREVEVVSRNKGYYIFRAVNV
ncbi:16S rRNA (guanine(1207)-N(2))-methyltransferase [Lentibacillus sp. JNUCC-1]|uniref:class I SAM-dependent methyltransferase n=1 Tax=Lentibacillus sp. JNUCC-1 TaxID=2654513 RepID=UPI0012E7B8E8|nr:class I SAM-dependent methyltransferase [Lentibacillus sp. JNUCC-1]MUV38073.1 16S rRNA (guanine(1207)-N(2))-methyltransferase [Lentibacillus sp. JNUCC-1]